MSVSRYILLLTVALPALAAPRELMIPNAHWEPIFFVAINQLAKTAGLQPLRQADLPRGSLEIRVWVGFGLSQLRGYRLRRDGKQWSGLRATEGRGDKWPFSAEPVSPKAGWDAFWKQLESLGILALPDSSTLPDEVMVLDGASYVVEISDGESYRTYHYGNPQYQKWPEAKKIIEIAEILYAELLPKKS